MTDLPSLIRSPASADARTDGIAPTRPVKRHERAHPDHLDD
ncbi:hypothetical protein [Actinomadura sp. CNU-125]|nr:hypothetical protein [Actinomadura sp. CNU-125]